MKIITVIMVAAFLVPVNGQVSANKETGSKTLWSPPDNTFTVESAVNLKKVDEMRGDPMYTKMINFVGETPDYYFGILIAGLSEKGKKSDVVDKFRDIEKLLAGDNAGTPKKRFMEIDNLTAQEIVFNDKHCRKGLLIDAKDRVITLAIVFKKCQNLNSIVAKHFFISFKLTKP